MGHVNVHVHLRGTLILWVMLTSMLTGWGGVGGVGHVNAHVHLRGMLMLVGASTREDAWITSGER